jgi:hypothetical protein
MGGGLPRHLLVGWLEESSKTSASSFALTGNNDQSELPRQPRPRTRSLDTFNREQRAVAALRGARLVRLLGATRSPDLWCRGPWTPGG